jgi:RNA polymerase sigma-70 factor (ECF subfamily)
MRRTGKWSESEAAPFEWSPALDESLLARVKRGDGRAFGELACRHWAKVYRVAWNMLPEVAAATQVAEATFLSLLKSGDAFPAGVPFTVSLYRVALGESWRMLNSALPRQPDAEALSVAARTRELLQQLERLDRAAYLLREVEELSFSDAAAVLGIAPASVRERTHAATMMLASAFSGAPVVPS